MNEVEHPGVAWRKALANAGLTQMAVAQSMGISSKHLNLIVNGKQAPSVEHTDRFARATGADLAELWQLATDHQLAQLGRRREKPRIITVQETQMVPTGSGEGLLVMELKVTIPAGTKEEDLMNAVAITLVQLVAGVWPQEEE